MENILHLRWYAQGWSETTRPWLPSVFSQTGIVPHYYSLHQSSILNKFNKNFPHGHFFKHMVCVKQTGKITQTWSLMRSLVVTPSEESVAEWRVEVRGLNLERSRGYAAEGKDGTCSKSQSGFWTTHFHIKGMNFEFRPAFSNSDLIAPASNADRNDIVLGVCVFALRRRLVSDAILKLCSWQSCCLV